MAFVRWPGRECPTPRDGMGGGPRLPDPVIASARRVLGRRGPARGTRRPVSRAADPNGHLSHQLRDP